MEETLVPSAGLPLETIDVRGIDLSSPRGVLGAGVRLPRATLRARRIIRRFRPDVVVGAAGYVCVPAALAARSLRVPVVLMEQNTVPGRAVRMLARGARAVATSFADTATYLPGARVVHTGNPVRPEVLALAPAPQRDRCTHVLVMGGSQGARRINDAVAGSVRHLLSDHPELRITHSCGARDAEWSVPVRAGLPEELRERYTVAAFFDDIAERIAAADLVVMRAGGSSLAEVSVLGRAMVLIPYPYAGGHQADNAAPYVRAGAAVVVPDEEFSALRLREEVEARIADPDRWRAMCQASAAMAMPDAAQRVVDLLHEVLAGRRPEAA
jgi:UDP-N-acetylglucosamine--N-acetylmuramyl-(pentapeptide) pyrophosphoryl-undecaprenol N-acetylglucosamine transferase